MLFLYVWKLILVMVWKWQNWQCAWFITHMKSINRINIFFNAFVFVLHDQIMAGTLLKQREMYRKCTEIWHRIQKHLLWFYILNNWMTKDAILYAVVLVVLYKIQNFVPIWICIIALQQNAFSMFWSLRILSSYNFFLQWKSLTCFILFFLILH